MDNNFKIAIDIANLDAETERLSRSYTTFGDAVRSVAEGVQVDVANLVNMGRDVSLPLMPVVQGAPGSQVSETECVQMNTYLQQWDRQDQVLTNTIEKMGRIKLGGMVTGAPKLPTVESPLVDIQVPGVSIASNKADDALQKVQESFDVTQGVEDEAMKRAPTLARFMMKEAEGAKSAIRGLVSKIPGGFAGGFMSGIIGSMILGYEEKNRLRAEMGEMKNVFVGGHDSIFKTESRKATRWFGNWAERAQWHYGIGRKETQKTLAEMVDNGFTSMEMMGTFDAGLKGVGKNVVVASIALDKHFNTATGTSMGNIVSYVREYGTGLQSATAFYMKMGAAGQRSGIGTQNFIRAVKSSGDAVSQLGVNSENVAVLLENVVGHYTQMGLNQRYAGKQAVGVVQDLMSAFSNLDDGMKVVLARKMYDDDETDTYSLLIQFQDGLRRIASGEEDQYLENLLRSYVELMNETGSSGRSRMIRTIQQNLGVRNRTASLIYDAGDIIVKGGKLADVSKEQRANIQKAFNVESTQVSRLHKMRRELVTGMSMFGQALSSIITDIASILVVGIRSLPALVWAFQEGKLGEVVGNVVAEQKRLVGQIVSHWDVGVEGLTIAGAALDGEFRSVFQPVVDALSDDFKAPKPPPEPSVPAVVREVLDVVDRKSEYKQVGERFNAMLQDEFRENMPFGFMADTPLWDLPVVGLKVPFQDELVGAMLQTTADIEIAGETEWAKQNPGRSAELRKKAAQGWKLDPVTGIMKNPKTGERWKPSTGENLVDMGDRDSEFIPMVGEPKLSRAITDADQRSAGHQH